MKSTYKLQLFLFIVLIWGALFLGALMIPCSANSDEEYEWTDPLQFTDNSANEKPPDISINPRSDNQSVQLAYWSNESNTDGLRYQNSAQFSNGSKMLVFEEISSPTESPIICSSSTGTVYIVFSGSTREGLIADNSGGIFTTDTNNNFTEQAMSLDAAIDEADNIHIVWENNTNPGGVYYRFYNTTSKTFGPTVHILDTDGDETSVNIDAWNTWENEDVEYDYQLTTVHIAFVDEDQYGDKEIRYTSNNGNLNNLTSQTPVWVTVNGYDDSQLSMALDKKETGVAHLVWVHKHSNEEYKVHYATSANWLAQKDVSGFSEYEKIHPDVIVDSNSLAHIVWSLNDDDSRKIQYIFVDELKPSDEFADPIPIQDISSSSTTQNDYPTITRDSSDNIHVVWFDGLNEETELYYAKRQPKEDIGGGEGIPGYSLLVLAASVIPLIYIIGRRLKKSD